MNDKKIGKSVVQKIYKEDNSSFSNSSEERLPENKVKASPEQKERRGQLEKLIDNDFEKYDDVFKALA